MILVIPPSFSFHQAVAFQLIYDTGDFDFAQVSSTIFSKALLKEMTTKKNNTATAIINPTYLFFIYNEKQMRFYKIN